MIGDYFTVVKQVIAIVFKSNKLDYSLVEFICKQPFFDNQIFYLEFMT